MFSQMIRFLSRSLLDIWGHVGIAPGWHYQTIDQFGLYLASPHALPAFLPNECQISCDLRDRVQRQIYFLGVYEPLETYLFTNLLKPGMTVIDAGANIGQYTLIASTIVGTDGAVHSFEPVPATFAQLNSNVKANRLFNVHLNQAALWHESTTLNLSLADEMSDNIGAYSVGVTNPNTAVESRAIRLDDYVVTEAIEKVDLIKMDIEGAEFCAVLGMQEILDRDCPLILMEINRLALQRLGYTPENLWLLLRNKFGYNGYLIGIDGCREINCLSQIQQRNILFVPRSYKISDFLNKSWNYKSVLQWARNNKKLFSR